ncbi:HNH endonuclease [Chloroflexota bacterium]
MLFVNGQLYVRRYLHERYGGQQQGGICTPSNQDFMMIFTGEQGEQYGYHDGWTDDGVFLYTGEGQIGDMTFIRGNRAILNHVEDGKDIHLFEYVRRGNVRYISQMICSGYQEREAPDRESHLRKVIVFELSPISAFDEEQLEPITEDDLNGLSLNELRERALQAPMNVREPTQRKQLFRYRSAAIRTYVLKRSEGVCESCVNPAPFTNEAGRPYLEPHHIRRLSDGGPDHPVWVAALCPNCHRRGHYSKDKEAFNNKLTQKIHDKENCILSNHI